ncbi:MAG: hypothetical protein H6709_17855 [Kofleriaceae bacterium]|nr:hypothetical protein [Kofleriaceae bacterium]MCB9573949.1 hypothetical protein [Kofleriaceae bacterium]
MRGIRRWMLTGTVVLALGGVALAGVKAGSVITVRVMSAKVMSGPKFIGATAGTVSRGDQLTVKEVKGDWYRVEGAATGWIHKTNIVDGKVALSSKPGGGGAGASRDEVELAGRGFTPQIEGAYRDQNPTLDFGHVDAIEQVTFDPGELEAFVREGGLAGGGQ